MKAANTLRPIAVLLISIAVIAPASEGAADFHRVPADSRVHISSALGGDASCEMSRHWAEDTILGYSSTFKTGERTVTYFDPATCGSVPYPFKITGFSFVLLDPLNIFDSRSYKWPVQLAVVVYDLYSPADSCLGPGTELYRIPLLCDSASYAYPAVGEVTFPTPLCVTRPFYIGIEYTDTFTGLLPSVMFDVSSDPDLCHIYQYYQNHWYGWYYFWPDPDHMPGFPFYWVQGETQAVSCLPDADSDGVPDADDNCPSVANADQADFDLDDIGDLCDPDDDADGVPDLTDNCQFVANTSQVNFDGDPLGDVCDPDDDNDGAADAVDNCALLSNPSQADSDSDGRGNDCDNCPYILNPEQRDNDHDGLGDVCDTDDDDDGVADGSDNCPLVDNPGQEDGNSDGVGDACSCVGTTGNVNCDPADDVTLGDVSVLIDHLFISGVDLCSIAEADANRSGGLTPTYDDITIGDVSLLIDHLFITNVSLPDCL